MRYGMGHYNEWKENKVSDYDKKTEGRELGLTGWEGNQTVEHHAKILAEQYGKEGAPHGKGTKYWDQAFNQLIRDGRKGGDVHGQFRDHQMSEEIADLRSQLDSKDSPDEPDEPEEAALDLSGISRNNTTDSARLASAKERSDAYRNSYTTSYDDNEAELPNEDDSEKAAASFMADYSLNLKDKLRNGTFNA